MNLQTLLTSVVLFLGGQTFGQLYINEVMAGNQFTIQDDFFEYEDWIEIYNSGSIVNLAGYYLSDNAEDLTKWQIPSTNPGLTTVLPNNHILFWFDNDPEQGEDHTTLRLSTDGEGVYLTMPDGVTIVDQIEFGVQQHDISYGRECDGCPDWIFFDIPTPDDENVLVLPDVAQLYINEVLVVNDSGIEDELGEREGWIEIHNPNPQQVNLSGYQIQHNGGSSHYFPVNQPDITTVSEEGFKVFWADNAATSAYHLAFELDPAGGEITLIGNDGSTIVDTYNYEPTYPDYSWGRTVDGGLTSQEFNIPTPRVTNTLVIIEPEELYINEFLAENDADTLDTAMETEDWIEIYNPNAYPVDVAGYFLSDNPNNPDKWQIPIDHPDSSIIAPGSYLIFFADEQGSEGWNHTNFRLSNNGESVILTSQDGFTIADQIDYGQQYADTSFGRLTDGAPQWVYFTETTPEYSNNGAAVNIEEEEGEPTSVNVYPNPVNRGSFLNWQGIRDYTLYDAKGNRITQGRGQQVDLDWSLSSGIYFIQIDQAKPAQFIIR